MIPDLRGVALRHLDLGRAQLQDAVLSGADLSSVNLRDADLSRADLRGALLTGADCRNANLCGAILADLTSGIGNAVVDITNADFTGALFGWTVIGDIYLNRITGVGQIRHVGPSYISVSTLEFTASEVAARGTLRTDIEQFLKGAGVLLESFKQLAEGIRSHVFHSAFISYSHVDKDFADWLHQRLEKRGVRCWLDEKNLVRGERILDAVAKAITAHERVLLCCSKSSLKSWWVKDEVRKAQELEQKAVGDLRVIPILLDDYLLKGWDDGLASDLRSRAAVDFTNWSATAGFESELERLLQALQKRP